MKRILIVEDKESQQSVYADQFGKYEVEISAAYDLGQAESILDHMPDLDLAVVDGCVPGYHYNTGPFIKKLRQKFAGQIVAASSDPRIRKEMLASGCDHQVEKYEVRDKVVELLNLQLRQQQGQLKLEK
jgi:CheY-like chemotaxis protein